MTLSLLILLNLTLDNKLLTGIVPSVDDISGADLLSVHLSVSWSYLWYEVFLTLSMK
jgi:hypothetical protein